MRAWSSFSFLTEILWVLVIMPDNFFDLVSNPYILYLPVPLDSDEQLSAYFSTLRPFTPPTGSSSSSVSVLSTPEAEQAVQKFFEQIDGQLQEKSIVDPLMDETNVMHMTSVLRKRKIKMRKHKYKKLRKRTRALRKKLGK